MPIGISTFSFILYFLTPSLFIKLIDGIIFVLGDSSVVINIFLLVSASKLKNTLFAVIEFAPLKRAFSDSGNNSSDEPFGFVTNIFDIT